MDSSNAQKGYIFQKKILKNIPLLPYSSSLQEERSFVGPPYCLCLCLGVPTFNIWNMDRRTDIVTGSLLNNKAQPVHAV
jgi:hypothetical protein